MEVSFNGNVMTVNLDGEIDHHSAKIMREEIDSAIEQQRPSQLILDFKNVTFMDSSGIGLVMGRFKLMQETGGSVAVENSSNHIRKVMKLSGIDRLASLR